jgi:hypothetical protein
MFYCFSFCILDYPGAAQEKKIDSQSTDPLGANRDLSLGRPIRTKIVAKKWFIHPVFQAVIKRIGLLIQQVFVGYRTSHTPLDQERLQKGVSTGRRFELRLAVGWIMPSVRIPFLFDNLFKPAAHSENPSYRYRIRRQFSILFFASKHVSLCLENGCRFFHKLIFCFVVTDW